MWGVCTHIHTHVIEYYQIFHLIFGISKKENPIMTTWMDLEGIMLSEKSLIKKDKYTISISGVEKQKTQQSTSS